MQFTLEGYKSLVRLLQEKNYECNSYIDDSPIKKHYILRHDIDVELQYAIKMAEVEKELGVNSTYFVLISSHFYNIHAKESRDLLKKIMACGHYIGLHFDEANYEQNDIQDMKKNIEKERIILSNAIEKEVQVVSMHRPSRTTIEQDLKIENMINTYGNKYFKEYKYISDSRRYWREDPISVIQSEKYDKLQILTHPIWYVTNTNSIKEAIEEMLKEKDIKNYEEMRNNFRYLEKEISEKQVLDSIKLLHNKINNSL